MSKSATRDPAIPRIQETAAYREAEARARDVLAQLKEAEAALDVRRRAETEGWREATARAIAEGRTVPARPELPELGELVARVEVLARAESLARQRLDATAKAESVRVLEATAKRREELVDRQAQALDDLVESTRAYVQLREELDAAGVHTSLVEWLQPFDLPFAESVLAKYREQAPFA